MSWLISKSIIKCRKHPSIISIHDLYQVSPFAFSTITNVDVLREINKLNKKKINHDDIPIKILKENVGFFAKYICFVYQIVIALSLSRKMEKLNSVFKEGSITFIILPVLSTFFEKIMWVSKYLVLQ